MLQSTAEFHFLDTQHLAMIGLIAIGCIAGPLLGKRWEPARARRRLVVVPSLVISLTVVLWVGTRVLQGTFDATTDLPLDICNLAALLMPLFAFRPNPRLHQVLYFWVLTGTLQAVLTPHLVEGFPHYTFLKYWIVHGGLLCLVVTCTAVCGYRPSLRGVLSAFGWLQVYAICVFLANLLLGSNYFYVMRKPPTASLLDYLGPWPWYILWAELITLGLFWIVYLPPTVWRAAMARRATPRR